MIQVCDKQREQNSVNAQMILSEILRIFDRLVRTIDKLRSELTDVRDENKELRQQKNHISEQLELAQARLREQASMDAPAVSPPICRERPLPGHQYTATLITNAIKLGIRVGFRAAEDVIAIAFDWFGIDQKVPSHDAIEQWTLRLGVASLQDPFTKDDRVLWMADHSSQIGKEKVLVIVGIALDDLPPSGETLPLEKMKVLAIVPGKSWKKEDVEREYRALAERIGPPVYLLCDGASELRDPAESLEKDGQKTIVLGDLKHHAANVLEKEIGRTEQFKSFMNQVGLTRNRVQQTELSHFAPPPIKQKSRFMNLGSLLRWGAMVLHHLDDVSSDARQGISHERMEEKFGWLREFSDELGQWRHAQDVIDCSLKVINHHRLDEHTAEKVESALEESVPDWQSGDTFASRIGEQLLTWTKESASSLLPGDQCWSSTEILESLFGRFKQLERQHSKGGFTQLIAALPTLCLDVTREMVREAFQRVNSPGLRQWLRKTLGRTLTARRNAAYHEYRRKTRNPAPSTA